MAGILLRALLKAQIVTPDHVEATVAHPVRAAEVSASLGVHCGTDNVAAVREADLVLIGVKPTQVAALVRLIAPALRPGALLVSIAASTRVEAIAEAAAGAPADVGIMRAMPNTPAALGAGATALVRGTASDAQVALGQRVFDAAGRTVLVDERHMDAVTGLSGSGPAFAYIILEALAEAGVNVGLPRDTATLLAAQTVYGAARMVLETGAHPALLKDEVTTPAGCTVDGILELEEGGLRVTLIKAVKRATERARQLAG
jgi:pyrroline-5-carboxylate reductase